MTDDQYRALARQLADELPVAVEKLTAAQAELAADRKERREFEGLVRLALKVGGGLIAVMLLLLGTNAVMTLDIINGRKQSRATAQSTNDNTAEIRKLAATMSDCTVAGGKCYEASAGRTAAAVKEINRQGALMTIEIRKCAYETAERFEDCLRERLPDLFTAPTFTPPPAPAVPAG